MFKQPQIQVVCRLRPLTKQEIKQCESKAAANARQICVQYDAQHIKVLDRAGDGLTQMDSNHLNARVNSPSAAAREQGPLAAIYGRVSPRRCSEEDALRAATLKNLQKEFTLDHVYSEQTTQSDLFDGVGKPIVSHVLQGYNGTILSYGQTGSGKTHSMFGPGGGTMPCFDGSDPLYMDRGLVPRMLEDLFEQLNQLDPTEKTWSLSFSAFEIYKEEISDLLEVPAAAAAAAPGGPGNSRRASAVAALPPRVHSGDRRSRTPRSSSAGKPISPRCSISGSLPGASASASATITSAPNFTVTEKYKIREDRIGGRGIYIESLEEVPVTSVQEALKLIYLAVGRRHTEATNANVTSSRSHCLICLYLSQTDWTQPDVAPDGLHTCSQLNLVDLSGSEKVAKTKATGERLKEAQQINLSLTFLGNVIHRLTDGHRGYVPYRDSKLTRILQESLGGNSITTLVCHCAAHVSHREETLSTLRFAQRAKMVKNKPRVNRELTQRELKEQLMAARERIDVLEQKVQVYNEAKRRHRQRPGEDDDEDDESKKENPLQSLVDSLMKQVEELKDEVGLKTESLAKEAKRAAFYKVKYNKASSLLEEQAKSNRRQKDELDEALRKAQEDNKSLMGELEEMRRAMAERIRSPSLASSARRTTAQQSQVASPLPLFSTRGGATRVSVSPRGGSRVRTGSVRVVECNLFQGAGPLHGDPMAASTDENGCCALCGQRKEKRETRDAEVNTTPEKEETPQQRHSTTSTARDEIDGNMLTATAAAEMDKTFTDADTMTEVDSKPQPTLLDTAAGPAVRVLKREDWCCPHTEEGEEKEKSYVDTETQSQTVAVSTAAGPAARGLTREDWCCPHTEEGEEKEKSYVDTETQSQTVAVSTAAGPAARGLTREDWCCPHTDESNDKTYADVDTMTEAAEEPQQPTLANTASGMDGRSLKREDWCCPHTEEGEEKEKSYVDTETQSQTVAVSTAAGPAARGLTREDWCCPHTDESNDKTYADVDTMTEAAEEPQQPTLANTASGMDGRSLKREDWCCPHTEEGEEKEKSYVDTETQSQTVAVSTAAGPAARGLTREDWCCPHTDKSNEKTYTDVDTMTEVSTKTQPTLLDTAAGPAARVLKREDWCCPHTEEGEEKEKSYVDTETQSQTVAVSTAAGPAARGLTREDWCCPHSEDAIKTKVYADAESQSQRTLHDTAAGTSTRGLTTEEWCCPYKDEIDSPPPKRATVTDAATATAREQLTAKELLQTEIACEAEKEEDVHVIDEEAKEGSPNALEVDASTRRKKRLVSSSGSPSAQYPGQEDGGRWLDSTHSITSASVPATVAGGVGGHMHKKDNSNESVAPATAAHEATLPLALSDTHSDSDMGTMVAPRLQNAVVAVGAEPLLPPPQPTDVFHEDEERAGTAQMVPRTPTQCRETALPTPRVTRDAGTMTEEASPDAKCSYEARGTATEPVAVDGKETMTSASLLREEPDTEKEELRGTLQYYEQTVGETLDLVLASQRAEQAATGRPTVTADVMTASELEPLEALHRLVNEICFYKKADEPARRRELEAKELQLQALTASFVELNAVLAQLLEKIGEKKDQLLMPSPAKRSMPDALRERVRWTHRTAESDRNPHANDTTLNPSEAGKLLPILVKSNSDTGSSSSGSSPHNLPHLQSNEMGEDVKLFVLGKTSGRCYTTAERGTGELELPSLTADGNASEIRPHFRFPSAGNDSINNNNNNRSRQLHSPRMARPSTAEADHQHTAVAPEAAEAMESAKIAFEGVQMLLCRLEALRRRCQTTDSSLAQAQRDMEELECTKENYLQERDALRTLVDTLKSENELMRQVLLDLNVDVQAYAIKLKEERRLNDKLEKEAAALKIKTSKLLSTAEQQEFCDMGEVELALKAEEVDTLAEDLERWMHFQDPQLIEKKGKFMWRDVHKLKKFNRVLLYLLQLRPCFNTGTLESRRLNMLQAVADLSQRVQASEQVLSTR